VDPKTGFFCNVLDLTDTVKALVVDPCEHRYLNDLPLFSGTILTMEGIAQRFVEVLKPALAAKGNALVSLQLGEPGVHWVRIDLRRGGATGAEDSRSPQPTGRAWWTAAAGGWPR